VFFWAFFTKNPQTKMFGFFGKNDGITHTYMVIIYIYDMRAHKTHFNFSFTCYFDWTGE
jgi:hypothetical protein